MALDQDKVMAFLGQVVTDMGAAGAAAAVVIGHRLGLYRALAQGSATPEQVAARTGCHERYLTEWLRGQAAGGYVRYDAVTGEFSMTEEQAFCLADAHGPNVSYDLVTTFDCLHDMGDPVGAARHVREALAPDGTWLVVEPFTGDAVEDNLNPVGRLYYAGSLFLCVPNAMSQRGGHALGAQAGEAAIHKVMVDAGFTRFRRVAQTPFNLVYEIRR